MRVDQLLLREDLGRITCETLADAWTDQHGVRHAVVPGTPAGHQLWRLQPLLSFYCTADANRSVRRLIADSFRYTHRARRAVPQYLGGSLLASCFGLSWLTTPAFGVAPAVPDAGWLAVAPGNRRLRIFDLRRRRCRVVLKRGFADGSMRAEIDLRTRSSDRFFVPLLASDPDYRWFEEPLVCGFTLARCPPWRCRSSYIRRAFSALACWLDRTERPCQVADYIREAGAALLAASATYEALYRNGVAKRVAAWLETLSRAAQPQDRIDVAQTHGDFQPGNVLVDPSSDQVFLVDWERSAWRFKDFDFLSWGLGMHSPQGVADRLSRFIHDGACCVPPGFLGRRSDVGWRRPAAAMLLLEELRWYLEDSLGGPFSRGSVGLELLLGEIGTPDGPVARYLLAGSSRGIQC